ncbi:SRPBCC family protein [Agrococcus sp. 1P02AA]|uniref:SRPBCC family protein n=1 Tax=Agrococcus sp. 1P02AA TaxID=3132259 RepID=UPI0039A71AF2
MTNAGDRIVAAASHDFAVSAEKVFDAWLDPELVRRWMGRALAESAPGTVLQDVRIDAREGGELWLVDSRDPAQTTPTGTFVELDRPRRLVFTWLPADGEHSVVSIDIEPTATGCTLVLRHEMEAEWQEHLERTQETWARMVRRLADAIGT